jgi:hypothetical protein
MGLRRALPAKCSGEGQRMAASAQPPTPLATSGGGCPSSELQSEEAEERMEEATEGSVLS